MLTVVHIITGLEDGGAEGVLYRLCSYSSTNITHKVISLTGEGKYGALLSQENIELHCLDMPSGRVTLTGVYRLFKILKANKNAVIQTWMYHADLLGGVVARLVGIKNIVWGIRSSEHDSSTKLLTRVVTRLCALLSWVIPKQIVCCAFNAVKVHSDLGYRTDKFIVINNGYDLEKFSPNTEFGHRFKTLHHIPIDKKVIGVVGRYHPQKDHKRFLLAVGELVKQRDDFVCLLIGSGCDDSNEELTELIAELGIDKNIYLLGQQTDMPVVMNSLDLLVLPSAFGEGFPNVVAEAMACEVPCVVTDVGDAALIVGETGKIVKARDVQGLKTAVSCMMDCLYEENIFDRKKSARDRISDNYSIKNMLSSYISIYSSLS